MHKSTSNHSLALCTCPLTTTVLYCTTIISITYVYQLTDVLCTVTYTLETVFVHCIHTTQPYPYNIRTPTNDNICTQYTCQCKPYLYSVLVLTRYHLCLYCCMRIFLPTIIAQVTCVNVSGVCMSVFKFDYRYVSISVYMHVCIHSTHVRTCAWMYAS